MTFINADAKITTHAAVTTNVHGTGAGNAVVGDDEITSFGKITSGSYTGNSSVNRAIPHGLGETPKLIQIDIHGAGRFIAIIRAGYIDYISDSGSSSYTVTAPDSTNFYVGNSGNYAQTGNGANDYTWVAFV